MNQFPLSPFLIKLRDDKIKVTVRDFERIRLALNTGGEWSVKRLRNVLLSLLVSNQEQEEVFVRRFNAYFTPETDGEEIFEEIDVRNGLAYLKSLSESSKVNFPTKIPTIPRSKVTKRPKSGASRLKDILSVAIPVVVPLVIIAFFAFLTAHHNIPITSISTKELEFDLDIKDKKNDTQKIVVKNSGKSNLIVYRVEISGENSTVFDLPEEISKKHILPEKALEIPIMFSPHDIDTYTATLSVYANTKNSPHVVKLVGSLKDKEDKLVTSTDVPEMPEEKLPDTRKYKNILYAEKDPEYDEFGISKEWLIYLGLSIFFLTSTSIFAVFIIKSRKIPEDEEPFWNEDKESPRHFSIGTIGGKPCPRIDDNTLDQLADSMGYFKSEQTSKFLDIDASIAATGESGGVPTLKFHNLRQIRSLIILEDAFAQPLTWNPAARELADGMERRGTPVTYGKFTNSVGEFMTNDGSLFRLEDMEDSKHGYLILIFTDGKNLCGHDANFDLEALAHWPMVAWMELRELRFWDAASSLPVRYGIPIYPATQEGILMAIMNFLTEQACRDNYSDYALNPRGLPTKAGVNFDAFLEQYLGGALTWAQDCSMIQPISPGLADGLRRKFHAQLPPECVERLYTMPGTTTSVSGLTFSDSVLKVLRNGFIARRSDDGQRKVLQFILKEIERGKPDDERSIAFLKWECIRERTYMELDPDYNLKRLSQLSKTHLSNHISVGFDNFGFPEEKGKIPLRHKPRNKYALQRLVKMSEKFPVSKLEAFPVEWWKWCCQGALFVLFAFFTFTCIEHHNDIRHYITMDNKEILDDTFIWIETQNGKNWKPYIKGNVNTVLEKSFEAGRKYRMACYSNGSILREEFDVKRGNNVKISLNRGDDREPQPCTVEDLDIGLYTVFCSSLHMEGKRAHGSLSWRGSLGEKAAEGRSMSIGLEIVDKDNQELSELGNSLLETGSVDRLYRITVGKDNAWHMGEVQERIIKDLEPCMEQSQLICWSSVPKSDIAFPSETLQRFGKVLNLGNDKNSSDIVALNQLIKYSRGQNGLITEEQISAVVKSVEFSGSGLQVQLISFTKEILVKGSCFKMGDTFDSKYADEDEKPLHDVCLEDFYLDEHEVTQGEWKMIMGGDNPSGFSECGGD